MRIKVGFGDGIQECEIPEKNLILEMHANPITKVEDEEQEVRRALDEPIGSPKLSEIVKKGEKIAIITSDVSRPMPTWKVIPGILEELGKAGVRDQDITVVFGLGSHRHQTEDEMRRLVGEEYFDRIKCMDSTPEDCIHLGRTKAGTPVDITRTVVEADRRICLGNIEFHYFAGYSGGAKAIMPGVSTPGAIQANHSMMLDERAHAGNIVDNPIRDDIEEAAAMCGVDFILNVVLDEHKRIVRAVAGDVTRAHREGCKFLDRLYKIKIKERADIVIASQGGAPKDLNLYQTQKALDNSKLAVKDGGTIILVGSCKEGFGQSTFEEWIKSAAEPEDLITRLKSEFHLGGHKAAAIAMVMRHANIILVSDMEDDVVQSIFMEPASNLQEAYNKAIKKQGRDASVIVMPNGGSTLPIEK
ncbi:MAG: nickel-dependent lactate racemase [Anaerovoracaceae bacterium]|jgi:nickel-dependent lactate racemase